MLARFLMCCVLGWHVQRQLEPSPFANLSGKQGSLSDFNALSQAFCSGPLSSSDLQSLHASGILGPLPSLPGPIPSGDLEKLLVGSCHYCTHRPLQLLLAARFTMQAPDLPSRLSCRRLTQVFPTGFRMLTSFCAFTLWQEPPMNLVLHTTMMSSGLQLLCNLLLPAAEGEAGSALKAALAARHIPCP